MTEDSECHALLPLGDRSPVIKVLVADDHALMRNGLRGMLDAQDDMEVVGEAEDGVEAVEEALRLHPHVVIMDIRMPRLDGIEATKRLVAQGDRAPRVLVLTTFDLDEYVYEALRAGAGGSCSRTRPRASRRRQSAPWQPGVRFWRPPRLGD